MTAAQKPTTPAVASRTNCQWRGKRCIGTSTSASYASLPIQLKISYEYGVEKRRKSPFSALKMSNYAPIIDTRSTNSAADLLLV
jgi:hypothetical protein